MTGLLADHLKQLWDSVERNQLSAEQFETQQERLLGEHREQWKHSLLLEGHEDLADSLLSELASYLGEDLDEIERRCRHGSRDLELEWREKVDVGHKQCVERFYNESERVLYELIWWHTLCDDNSPLAYVTALHFAQKNGCRACLDFGAGVSVRRRPSSFADR